LRIAFNALRLVLICTLFPVAPFEGNGASVLNVRIPTKL